MAHGPGVGTRTPAQRQLLPAPPSDPTVADPGTCKAAGPCWSGCGTHLGGGLTVVLVLATLVVRGGRVGGAVRGAAAGCLLALLGTCRAQLLPAGLLLGLPRSVPLHMPMSQHHVAIHNGGSVWSTSAASSKGRLRESRMGEKRRIVGCCPDSIRIQL
jgi:hypothetical protein